MDATLLNTLRDPAGVPFYPVVFQALYVLTWALHAAFVLLAIGSITLSLAGHGKQKQSADWKLLTGHMIQTGKISISLAILLGIAPLLFTQVIYDPNWYVTNALSGIWVFTFIYALIVGYMLFYWFYYANKKGDGKLIGLVSFAFIVFAGVLMHVFSVESIQPNEWMGWYAPGGTVDTSGLSFHMHPVRLLFMVSLSAPVVGIFLQNYSDFLSTRNDFTKEYIAFARSLGTTIASIGLLASAALFVVWMFMEGLLLNPLSLAIVVSVLLLLVMIHFVKRSYLTTLWLVVVALLISGMRELIRFQIMGDLGYSVYDYPMNIDWPSVVMFLLTFVFLGFTGVAFIATLAWRAGKSEGVFDASKDALVSRLANSTFAILIVWCLVYFGWGMFTVFKNSFA
ncbi:hypothetical protein WCX49_00330 [Sulfurimonas sp. HSL-1656]|uniref:hypothetical protein n=1 Tax=Thiomicrolovo subterrani TaxID=3131934 RepID=UPI0031F99B92